MLDTASPVSWLHLLCATVNVARPVREGCAGCGEFADHPAEVVALRRARHGERGPYRARSGARFAVEIDALHPATP